VAEGIDVLAAQTPDLHAALRRVADEGWSHVILDGKLFATDRLAETTTSAEHHELTGALYWAAAVDRWLGSAVSHAVALLWTTEELARLWTTVGPHSTVALRTAGWAVLPSPWVTVAGAPHRGGQGGFS